MFNSNGIDQRTTDLVLRPQPTTFTDVTTLSGRSQVDPSTLSGAVHLICIGQSTNDNCVNSTYSPANPSKLFNLSIAHRGACFVALEPLLSGDLIQGHPGFYLGDQLVTDGAVSKVLISNLSIGGTYVAHWCPGGGLSRNPATSTPGELAYRIGLAARCIANAGLSGLKTVIDWHQGESDSDPGPTSQANYTAALNGVIAEFKNVALLKTGNVMFVNLATRITNATADRNIIRAAQAAVVDGVLVRSGADTDSLDSSNRYDGVHWNATGAAALAALKKVGIKNFIANG